MIETQGSILQVPHWKDLIRKFAIPASTLFRAQIGAVRAIEAIAHDYELLKHLPHLRDLPDEFNVYEGGRRRTNMATAVERLPELVAEVPTYNLHSRMLRQTASDLATPTSIAEYVAAQTAHDTRLPRRVHRVRNSLTHGGPINSTIVEGASEYIVSTAKHITAVTLRALLDGEAPTESLRKYRDDTAAWTADLAKATTISESLFPGMADGEHE